MAATLQLNQERDEINRQMAPRKLPEEGCGIKRLLNFFEFVGHGGSRSKHLFGHRNTDPSGIGADELRQGSQDDHGL